MTIKPYHWYLLGAATFIAWTLFVFLALETMVFSRKRGKPRRTETVFILRRITPMKVFSFVCMLVAVPALSSAQASSKTVAASPARSTRTSTAVRTIELTGDDTMKYDVTSIHARPGERLHVVLRSAGTAPKVVMAHNFVLLKAGVKPEDFATAAMNARETDFIPPAMQEKVIVAKGLVGPGETVDVTFTAPMKPGTYTYLCSFPGHYMVGMKGELVVK
jgi:azurin